MRMPAELISRVEDWAEANELGRSEGLRRLVELGLKDETDMNSAVIARLASLEALIIGTMGLMFAMAGNDPDMSKQKAFLAVLKTEFESGLGHLPQEIQDEAKAHMSDLLDRVILRTNQLRSDHRAN